MSKTSLYIFPFKLSATGDTMDGIMQPYPVFCRKQCNTKACRDFYDKACAQQGGRMCPYGFAVFTEDICGSLVTFTGLDVVGVSDKKLVQKRITKKDYVPRLTKQDYANMVAKMKENVTLLGDYYSHKHATLLAADDYQTKIDTLDNTFHELRKLNRRLKASVEWMIASLDNNFQSIDTSLLKASKDIFAASQLITIRLSTYDLILNPNSSLNYTKSPIPIYKKFDKVARLLDYQAQESGAAILISGNSFSTYECNDMVELLPYLLLDNAIKYTMRGKDIKLEFSETGRRLIVKVISFSQRPAEHELNNLFDRGVRSNNVTEKTPGQGLGLYIARYICDANNITINLKIGKKVETDQEGIKYSDFIVTLQFDGIVKSNTVS